MRTGAAIVARFHGEQGSGVVDPMAVPACLVAGHSPFRMGQNSA